MDGTILFKVCLIQHLIINISRTQDSHQMGREILLTIVNHKCSQSGPSEHSAMGIVPQSEILLSPLITPIVLGLYISLIHGEKRRSTLSMLNGVHPSWYYTE